MMVTPLQPLLTLLTLLLLLTLPLTLPLTLASRVAVILTDTKMDDKGGVAVALLKRDHKNAPRPQYSKVILIFTGVEDRSRVSFAMAEFLKRAAAPDGEGAVYPLPADWQQRTVFLQAPTNIMGPTPTAHEAWYADLDPPASAAPEVATPARVAHETGEAPVDSFQIAPCEDALVWGFMDAVPHIRIYHLFFGYNSRLSAKHGPRARVIFTQNVPTFGKPKGGSMRLEWVMAYLPRPDVLLALRDPFWTSTIKEANEFAEEEKKIEELPGSDGGSEQECMTRVVDARLRADSQLRRRLVDML